MKNSYANKANLKAKLNVMADITIKGILFAERKTETFMKSHSRLQYQYTFEVCNRIKIMEKHHEHKE